MDRLIQGFKIMRNILSQPSLAGFHGKESPKSAGAKTDLQIEQFIRDNADTIYHPVGTRCMGSGPNGRGGCTVARGHGLQGLRAWWTRPSCRASWAVTRTRR